MTGSMALAALDMEIKDLGSFSDHSRFALFALFASKYCISRERGPTSRCFKDLTASTPDPLLS